MRILVANDDGIYSPGLLALAQAARDFGEVRIVAPTSSSRPWATPSRTRGR